MFIGARGGAGGKGNYFYLSNSNRAPMEFEEGGRGEERLLHLELRIMAFAGLVSHEFDHNDINVCLQNIYKKVFHLVLNIILVLAAT